MRAVTWLGLALVLCGPAQAGSLEVSASGLARAEETEFESDQAFDSRSTAEEYAAEGPARAELSLLPDSTRARSSVTAEVDFGRIRGSLSGDSHVDVAGAAWYADSGFDGAWRDTIELTKLGPDQLYFGATLVLAFDVSGIALSSPSATGTDPFASYSVTTAGSFGSGPASSATGGDVFRTGGVSRPFFERVLLEVPFPSGGPLLVDLYVALGAGVNAAAIDAAIGTEAQAQMSLSLEYAGLAVRAADGQPLPIFASGEFGDYNRPIPEPASVWLTSAVLGLALWRARFSGS